MTVGFSALGLYGRRTMRILACPVEYHKVAPYKLRTCNLLSGILEGTYRLSVEDREMSVSFIKEETETAICFVNELESRLANWMELKSTIEVDEAIQTFSSAFFSGERKKVFVSALTSITIAQWLRSRELFITYFLMLRDL